MTIPHSFGLNSDTPSMEWGKTYYDTFDSATSVIQTSDGGYALAGYTNSVSGLVKFSHDGIQPSREIWLIIAIVAVVITVVVTGGVAYYFRKRKPSIPPPSPSPQA